MLGVASGTTNPSPEAYWALVLDRGTVVGAGLRTDKKLIISREGMVGAMATLAANAVNERLHDVIGPRHAVESFVLATGGSWHPVMSQGIYECRRVIFSSRAAGSRRLATPADRERVADYVYALSSEALGEFISATEALARTDAHIARASMHVWDDAGEIVSVAAAVAPTRNGIRINNVYTPPERRGRGYAGALVASTTRALLESGRQFVFLHTDLANPVSNRLYVHIGYRQVGDLDVLSRTPR